MLKIRLRRMGKKKSPFYRLVVSDSRSVPGSTALEEVGTYNPTKHPAEVRLDTERIDYWVKRGAQLSDTVANLVTNYQPTESVAS